MDNWKKWAKKIKSELYALYFAYKDPRLSKLKKLFIILVISYAFSPIDLVPDFIPILGYLDDLILLPIGIYFALKMIPDEVLVEAREKAKDFQSKPKSWTAGIIIIILWFLIAFSIIYLIVK